MCHECFCTTTEVPSGGHTHAHVFVARCGGVGQNEIYSICKSCAVGPDHLVARAKHEEVCRQVAYRRKDAAAGAAAAGGSAEGSRGVYTAPTNAAARLMSGLRGFDLPFIGESAAAAAAAKEVRERNLTVGGRIECGGLPFGLKFKFSRPAAKTNMADLAIITGRDDSGIATMMEALVDSERALQEVRLKLKTTIASAVITRALRLSCSDS